MVSLADSDLTENVSGLLPITWCWWRTLQTFVVTVSNWNYWYFWLLRHFNTPCTGRKYYSIQCSVHKNEWWDFLPDIDI